MKLNDTMMGLNVVDNLVDNAKAIIVINHGFAEHIGRYDWVSDQLNAHGYSVVRYDVKEHGDSLGKVEHFTDFIADLRGIVVHARTIQPGIPVFNLGHSMGGLITALFGLEFGEMVDGQILSGPALGHLPAVAGIKKMGVSLLAKIAPNVMIKNVVENDICSDPEVVEAYKNDPKVLTHSRSKFIYEFAVAAPQYILDNVKSYECDVLLLHGEKDIIVPVELSENFLGNISSQDKELIIYPKLYHEILNEKSKGQVMSDILEWLEKKIS